MHGLQEPHWRPRGFFLAKEGKFIRVTSRSLLNDPTKHINGMNYCDEMYVMNFGNIKNIPYIEEFAKFPHLSQY